MERVWKRLVAAAHDHVARRIVLSEHRAREIVLEICACEQVERVADDLLDYLAWSLARRTR
jgi:hypothetical protein